MNKSKKEIEDFEIPEMKRCKNKKKFPDNRCSNCNDFGCNFAPINSMYWNKKEFSYFINNTKFTKYITL